MRSLKKMQTINDGTRSLMESVMMPEIIVALNDLKQTDQIQTFVLIGGIALSHYVKPRMTQDIDVLLISDSEIPDSIPNFKKIKAHAFQHDQTHVEVEMVTPEYVGIPKEVVEKIIETAIHSDGFKIASPSGLVVSKLFRLSPQDIADIVSLINACDIQLNNFNLNQTQINKFFNLNELAEQEKLRPKLGD